jgi:hypothetical protein
MEKKAGAANETTTYDLCIRLRSEYHLGATWLTPMPAMSRSKGSWLERQCEIISVKFLAINGDRGGGSQTFFKEVESNNYITQIMKSAFRGHQLSIPYILEGSRWA